MRLSKISVLSQLIAKQSKLDEDLYESLDGFGTIAKPYRDSNTRFENDGMLRPLRIIYFFI